MRGAEPIEGSPMPGPPADLSPHLAIAPGAISPGFRGQGALSSGEGLIHGGELGCTRPSSSAREPWSSGSAWPD